MPIPLATDRNTSTARVRGPDVVEVFVLTLPLDDVVRDVAVWRRRQVPLQVDRGIAGSRHFQRQRAGRPCDGTKQVSTPLQVVAIFKNVKTGNGDFQNSNAFKLPK